MLEFYWKRKFFYYNNEPHVGLWLMQYYESLIRIVPSIVMQLVVRTKRNRKRRRRHKKWHNQFCFHLPSFMLMFDCLLISHFILCSFVICSVSFRIQCAINIWDSCECVDSQYVFIVLFFVELVVVFTFFISFVLCSFPFLFFADNRNLFISFGRLALFFNTHFLICLPVWQTAKNDYSQQLRYSKWPVKIWIWVFLPSYFPVVGIWNKHKFKHLIKYMRCSSSWIK